MKQYRVDMPATAVVTFYVEAENEDEAVEKCFDQDWTIGDTGNPDVEVTEMDICKTIVQGNVFRGIQNGYDVEEI